MSQFSTKIQQYEDIQIEDYRSVKSLTPKAFDYLINATLYFLVLNDVNSILLISKVWNLVGQQKDDVPVSIVKRSIPILFKLLVFHENPEILSQSLVALSLFSDVEESHPIFLDGNYLQILNEFLLREYSNDECKISTLHVLSNLLNGGEEDVQLIIDMNLIPQLVVQIDSKNLMTVKEVVDCIANIAASTLDHLQLVINTGLIPKLFVLMKSSKQEIRHSSFAAIFNTTSGSFEHNLYLISVGFFDVFCELITSEEFDTENMEIVLESFANILGQAKAEGHLNELLTEEFKSYMIPIIESLQRIDLPFYKQWTCKVLTQYFDLPLDDAIEYA